MLQEQKQPGVSNNKNKAETKSKQDLHEQEKEQAGRSSSWPKTTSLKSNAHTADHVSGPGRVNLTNLGVTNHCAVPTLRFFGEMDSIKEIGMLDYDPKIESMD